MHDAVTVHRMFTTNCKVKKIIYFSDRVILQHRIKEKFGSVYSMELFFVSMQIDIFGYCTNSIGV